MILNDKNEVLLLKRTEKSKFDAGFWTMIVGEVNFGETMAEAIKREAMEEAGIEIEILRNIMLVEILPHKTGVHWVGVDYLCKHVSGVVQNKELLTHECLEWFPLNKLPEKVSPSTRATIAEYFKQEQS